MTISKPPNVSSRANYTAEDVARFQGFVLKDGRRGGLCWDEKPRCVGRIGEPYSHRIRPRDPEALKNLTTEAIVRCHHRRHNDDEECGALLYIAVLSFGGSAVIRGTGERSLLVVEITGEIAQRMRNEPTLFLQKMALVDVALPGVGMDVGVPRELTEEEKLQVTLREAEEARRRAGGKG